MESRSEISTVLSFIELQAGKTPSSIAVSFGRTDLTYNELLARVQAAAFALRENGVGREVPVCVFLPRSIEMLVAILGIMKAGGAYVPLDPANPKDRLNLVVEDSASPVIVTSQSLIEKLPRHNAKIVFSEEFESLAKTPKGSSVALKTELRPADLAYVMYTSGSTGKPKGVEIEHRALANFMTSMQREPGIMPSDILIAVTTLSFDISGLELLLPLTVGARVVIADQETVTDGIKLMQLMTSAGATFMQATPATWRMLMDAGWKGDSRLKILCGGEPLPRTLADQLLDRCGSLWNVYGPTETTIWSTVHKVEKDNATIPIGHPIDETTVYVVDADMKPVKTGEIGELLIGGTGLARSYRGRPDLTAEKFVANPFGPGRLYITGDLARFRDAKVLECLGRVDHQVKIRGFRIELGEIEHALHGSSQVKVAVVSAKDDPSGEKQLVAYCQPNAGQTINFGELTQIAAKRLPPYMVPSFYVQLSEFPLTSNGKIDRKALPNPDWSARAVHSDKEFEAPVGEVELKIAELWKKILAIEKIGRNDSFISIGGNSITLTRLSHRISEVFDVQIHAASLFRRPTISQMAELIKEHQEEQ